MVRTAKENWLWRYREAKFIAESLWRQVAEWEETIYKPSCRVIDGMPHSPNFQNNQEEAVVSYIDLIDEARCATTEAKKIRKEISQVIETLSDIRAVKILTLRYLEGLSWDDIRDKLNYSKNHAQKIHHDAINEIKTRHNPSECV